MVCKLRWPINRLCVVDGVVEVDAAEEARVQEEGSEEEVEVDPVVEWQGAEVREEVCNSI